MTTYIPTNWSNITESHGYLSQILSLNGKNTCGYANLLASGARSTQNIVMHFFYQREPFVKTWETRRWLNQGWRGRIQFLQDWIDEHVWKFR